MTTEAGASALSGDTEVYQYLERRPDSWRRQLFLKGRNMAVGQLVWKMRANSHHTPEAAAEEYDLPLAQVYEALEYYERHPDIVAQDDADERRYLQAQGIIVDPPALHR